MSPPAHLAPRIRQMLASYHRWLGSPLCEPGALFTAPMAVLAHATETPPLLWYANQTALDLWHMTWDQMVGMPSRDTAEPGERAARAAFMEAVARDGYTTGYTGVRIARTGARFLIENATVWNIIDEAGRYQGQAATFATWRPL